MNIHRSSLVAIVLSLIAGDVLTCRAQEPSQSSASSLFKGSSKSSGKTDTLPPKEAAKACLVTADEMVRNGYRKEAIALYERARDLDPTQQQVCRYLAVLYDEVGTDSQALTEYNHAVRLTPKDPDLLNDFGYFYYHRHDMRQAEQWFRAAIVQSPRHERAWVNLGLTLGEQGRYQDSFEAFSKVLSTAAAHSNVGMILARHGQIDDAAWAFKQALMLDPGLQQPRAVLASLDTPRPVAEQQVSTAPHADRPPR